MKVEDIVSCLQAEALEICSEDILKKDYRYAFATDLMSDALAMIQHSPEATVLITGLANAQTLRTAEMLDIDLIFLVRGKVVSDDILEIAKENKVTLFTTKHTMYSACGCLYSHGLRGIND